MNNLSLNNGNIITVANSQDILSYIGKDYSYEIAKELESVITTAEEMDLDAIYEKEKAHTDAESYEAELEDMKNSMSDIMDIIINLQNYVIDGNRLNRDKINKDLTEIRIKLREYV